MENQLFLLLLLFPNNIVAETTIAPECICDGTEYVIPANVFRSFDCGKLAICQWELKHYMDNVLEYHKDIKGLHEKEVLEKDYTTMIGENYGYPIRESLEEVKDCKEDFAKCQNVTKHLLEAECKRVSGKWEIKVKERKPYAFDVTQVKAVLGKDLPPGNHGLTPHSLESKIRFKDPLDNAFFSISCPSPFGDKFTMANILFMEAGFAYRSYMSYQSLARLLPAHVVKAEWCDVIFFKYDEFYRPWNGSIYCENQNTRDNFLCVNLKETEENRRKREPFKECGFKPGTVHNSENIRGRNRNPNNFVKDRKDDPVWHDLEDKSPDYLAAFA